MRTKLSSQCHVPSRLRCRSNGEQIDNGSVGITDFAVISRDYRHGELPAAPLLVDRIVNDLSRQNVHLACLVAKFHGRSNLLPTSVSGLPAPGNDVDGLTEVHR